MLGLQNVEHAHGRLWKSLMRAHVGDYEAKERQLAKIAGKAVPRARPAESR